MPKANPHLAVREMLEGSEEAHQWTLAAYGFGPEPAPTLEAPRRPISNGFSCAFALSLPIWFLVGLLGGAFQ